MKAALPGEQAALPGKGDVTDLPAGLQVATVFGARRA